MTTSKEPAPRIVPNPPPNPATRQAPRIVPNPGGHSAPSVERTTPTEPPTTPPLKK
ncbi:hypothetical protein OWM54_01865 [Myxococcus sp. MISCRS1]|uniref:hypothetical protein n=1 Tax=Myxococcus TaxID=32 RepID=UPI001CBCEE4A|nr:MULTISPECIES: hypothetical protein [unclassified Myxococcus]MBZ4399350.1 hypothetical protein [Myxococcus sp. AS-1-15]MBZ4413437.1 hypothetical protein [Myxococcus sp. XM-1-1-1]MCY0995878.1 hypothetical protein [Myxococcus sp. MISCRS1]BDT34139.1 hypothetical protein MFMH1_38080 [Myxococcus sp. MH1]